MVDLAILYCFNKRLEQPHTVCDPLVIKPTVVLFTHCEGSWEGTQHKLSLTICSMVHEKQINLLYLHIGPHICM